MFDLRGISWTAGHATSHWRYRQQRLERQFGFHLVNSVHLIGVGGVTGKGLRAGLCGWSRVFRYCECDHDRMPSRKRGAAREGAEFQDPRHNQRDFMSRCFINAAPLARMARTILAAI